MGKLFSASEHGGSIRKGHRKVARPFSAERPIHVTMRASRARGRWSFLHSDHKGIVHLLVLDTVERYQLELLEWQNVGNHLHLVVQAPSKKQFQSFLRVLPQRIVFAVTGTCRTKRIGRFWDLPAHTRLVHHGRELKIVLEYIWKNRLEALGFGKEEIAEMRANARSVPL